jgi:hypothetical protein
VSLQLVVYICSDLVGACEMCGLPGTVVVWPGEQWMVLLATHQLPAGPWEIRDSNNLMHAVVLLPGVVADLCTWAASILRPGAE